MTDQELKNYVQETSRQIRALSQQIGGLANKFGSFTEGMAFASMKKLLKKRFHMNVITPHVEADKGKDHFEIDVMAYANTSVNQVYLVEVKSHLREEGIEQLMSALEKFPIFFPEHQDKQRFGILAVVHATEEMKERVLKSGLYLAMIHEDLFKLEIPRKFKPRNFAGEGAA